MSRVNVKNWDGTGGLPTLYSKTATGAINVWMCWVFEDEVRVSWGQMNGTLQEAAFKCTPKNVGKKNETTAHQQAVKEAISKWEKQVKLRYSPSLETAGETDRIKPLLAGKFPDHKAKITYPVDVQPKLEGVRCLAYRKDDGSIILQARKGDPYLLPHIIDRLSAWLPDQVVLDGELYVHGLSQQEINSLVRRPRYPECSVVMYCLYDITTKSHNLGLWKARAAYLDKIYEYFKTTLQEGLWNAIWRVPDRSARDEAEVLALHSGYVAAGYEGAIIRLNELEYREDHRSPHLLKLKTWEDDEFEIVGWAVGKGQYENVPIFACRMKDGKTFNVMPKGSREHRYEMLKAAPTLIGKMLTVQYFGLTNEGKPYHARGIAIREDI